jgi:hypothetical protein
MVQHIYHAVRLFHRLPVLFGLLLALLPVLTLTPPKPALAAITCTPTAVQPIRQDVGFGPEVKFEGRVTCSGQASYISIGLGAERHQGFGIWEVMDNRAGTVQNTSGYSFSYRVPCRSGTNTYRGSMRWSYNRGDVTYLKSPEAVITCP